MTICERVLDLLQQKSMTRKVLSERMDVSASTLNTWMLRGEDFPARYVASCAAALGVSVAFLLTGEEDPESVPPPGYAKLSEDEIFIIRSLRKLDTEGRLHIQGETVQELRRVKAARGNGSTAGTAGAGQGKKIMG